MNVQCCNSLADVFRAPVLLDMQHSHSKHTVAERHTRKSHKLHSYTSG